jgi:hypothetical protein
MSSGAPRPLLEAGAVGLWGNRAFTISRTRRLIMRPEFEKPDAASPT